MADFMGVRKKYPRKRGKNLYEEEYLFNRSDSSELFRKQYNNRFPKVLSHSNKYYLKVNISFW